MNLKNIFIALIFLGVVGLALTGMFRNPAAPEAVPSKEVSAINTVGDVSSEDSAFVPNAFVPNQDEPEMAMDEGSPPNMENISKEEKVYPSLIDEQGAVTVEVTPLNLENASETLDFKIALNTHSVDLSMDLAALATLTTDTGKVIQATSWDAPLGGHHVSGTLSFPAIVDGVSVLDSSLKITLSLVNVDAPERVFTWER
jgi:hypothetical protein